MSGDVETGEASPLLENRATDEAGRPDDPWYRDGLAFECTQCGNCCSGPPGAIWLTDEELAAIAEHESLPLDQAKALFTHVVLGRRSLRERANGDCIFLHPHTRRCQIYELRPTQCRTWPFWNGNLNSPDCWERAGGHCPGINRGALVPLETIEERRRQLDL